MKTIIDIGSYRSPLAGLLKNPESYKREQFAKAAQYVREGMTMHVGKNGVWSGSFEATGNTSRYLSSYERIGYHSGAEWFLQGFLLSGGKVVFHGFSGIEGEVTL